METNLITEEAKRFKAFRLAEKLTQKEIGEIIGRTESHVNKIEGGTRNIKIEDIKILHEKLQLSYEWFYHGKGNRKYIADKSNTFQSSLEVTNNVKLLLQKVSELDQAIKKIYRDFYAKS